MRRTTLAVLFLALTTPLATPAAAQRAGNNDPTMRVAGSGVFPGGWHVFLDPNRFDHMTVKDLSFTMAGDSYHVTTGPAGIYWTDKDSAPNGSYTVTATFSQLKAPGGHGEAYGLVVAGRDLTSADKQSYVYFVVRGGDDYLINHRAGMAVHKLVNWTSNAAVKGKDGAGKATNVLSIAVGADSVRFLANGTQVAALSRAALGDLSGSFGFRVNHNSDVAITDLQFRKH
ncbi:MAG TPA: hypothetical protein VNE60_12215 [Gemmatimonadaceae bacterium]|nr:hypothetical protein [Gemmatimonadaceae bacterium]